MCVCGLFAVYCMMLAELCLRGLFLFGLNVVCVVFVCVCVCLCVCSEICVCASSVHYCVSLYRLCAVCASCACLIVCGFECVCALFVM